mgnify:CR=1 FL=1
MEPGHEDREYRNFSGQESRFNLASMEPGHEDREYPGTSIGITYPRMPQWSPVMKTGNTRAVDEQAQELEKPQWSPVMKTGNTPTNPTPPPHPMRLNGARS